MCVCPSCELFLCFFFHLEWLCSQCYRKVCLRLSVHDRCISFFLISNHMYMEHALLE